MVLRKGLCSMTEIVRSHFILILMVQAKFLCGPVSLPSPKVCQKQSNGVWEHVTVKLTHFYRVSISVYIE